MNSSKKKRSAMELELRFYGGGGGTKRAIVAVFVAFVFLLQGAATSGSNSSSTNSNSTAKTKGIASISLPLRVKPSSTTTTTTTPPPPPPVLNANSSLQNSKNCTKTDAYLCGGVVKDAVVDETVDVDDNDNNNSTKKDKRQAQRGYTDIPIDERSFDELFNSSPAPLPSLDNDLPELAESSTPSYLNLPNPLDQDRFSSNVSFSPRIGYPASPPRMDNVPAEATNIQKRQGEDFFETYSGDGRAIPGEPVRDYPTFAVIPRTSFSCKQQQWPGYYADTEARCQVFWICQKHRMDAFLCPNGTLFNQQVFVCDWWFNVDCPGSPEYYSRNQFLYQGPQVGIDGSPTRLRGLPPPPQPIPLSGGAGSSFVPSVALPPRPQTSQPSGVGQGEKFVQSSNQVQRVASLDQRSNNNNRQQQPIRDYTGPPPVQNYLASPSQQTPTKVPEFSTPKSQYVQQQQQQLQHGQNFLSVQNMLSNRMHKISTNPTLRPNNQALSSTSENSLTGGYLQQQKTLANHQHVTVQVQQSSSHSSSSADRREFQQHQQQPYQNNNNYHAHNNSAAGLVTTLRPPGPIIPTQQQQISSSSGRTLTIHKLNANVNVDPRSGNKQPIIAVSGSISSTARPIAIRTEVPSYNHGSSTLQTPKDREHSQSHNQYLPQQQQQQPRNNALLPVQSPTTSAPITTTFRSTSTSYSSNLGFSQAQTPAQNQNGAQFQQLQHPQGVGNKQVGAVGTVRPLFGPSSTPGPQQQPHYSNSSNNSNNYVVSGGFVPNSITTQAPPPPIAFSPQITQNHNHKYVDRHGVVHQQHQQYPTTPGPDDAPLGLFTNSPSQSKSGFTGQRSNQWDESNSNYNGQREVMYSYTSKNPNMEYPFSPSQQKNKVKLLEFEKLKSLTSPSNQKPLHAYPHYHGQRSNAYSEVDGSEDEAHNNNEIPLTSKQQQQAQYLSLNNYHQLPGEGVEIKKKYHSTTAAPSPTTLRPSLEIQQSRYTPQPSFNTPVAVPQSSSSSQGGNSNNHYPQQQLVVHEIHRPQTQQSQQQQQQQQFVRQQQQQNSFGQQLAQHHHQQQQQQQFSDNIVGGENRVSPQNQVVIQQIPTQSQSHSQQAQQYSPQVHHNNPQYQGQQGPPPQNHQQQQQYAQLQAQAQAQYHQQLQNQLQQQQQTQYLQQSPTHQVQLQQQQQPQGQGPQQGSQVVYHPPLPHNTIHVTVHQPTQHQTHEGSVVSASPSDSHSPQFHRQIVQQPHQNLRLPSPTPQSLPDFPQRDGFTSVKSGSFVSVASTASPPAFSKQILSQKQNHNNDNHNLLVFTTPVPNGLVRSHSKHSAGLSTTGRPIVVHSTSASFSVSDPAAIAYLKGSKPKPPRPSPSTSPLALSSNGGGDFFLPTENPVVNTSPGHRHSPFLPHNHGTNHGKRNRGHKQQQGHRQGGDRGGNQKIQYPSAISTTISYPEGTGSLKIAVPGATKTHRLVDFSYSAHPKSSTASSIIRVTTPSPNSISSTPSPSRRPHKQHHHHKNGGGGGARLAGAVTNKSTSSSSAIYVDTSAVASESVSTPVSVSPLLSSRGTPAPSPVSTSNFGLRISTMAKKRMAGAWQNYFAGSPSSTGGNNEESENENSS